MTEIKSQLIDQIYEAAAIPELWPALLTNLCRDVGAAGGAFLSALKDRSAH
jgi:hypothetical protein